MSTAPSDRVIPGLLHGLIDDAGLFPPARLPMHDAIVAHLRTRRGPWAAMVGRFLVPASRFGELTDELEQHPGEDPVRVGIIADVAAQQLIEQLQAPAGERTRVELVEIAAPTSDLADLHLVSSLFHGAAWPYATFIELPRTEGWERDLDVKLGAVRAFGHGAKLRTGGLVAEAFPSEAEVAGFIRAAATAGIRFKLTAGLHHALRHTDPETGFEHHGFLNVAIATARPGEAEAWLAERDGDIVVAAICELAAEDVRRHWQAYGSCSIAEPVDDLIALGLLEEQK